jgi:putative membrane protein insertion efficiency factor
MGFGDPSEESCSASGVRRIDGGIFAVGEKRDGVMAVPTEKNETNIEAGACAFEAHHSAPVNVGAAARVGLMALRFYKAYLSLLFAGNCRFVPSCSQYSYEAVERFGLARGSWLTLRRLLRCHPFSGKFGFDPVPDYCGDDAEHRHAAGIFEGQN